MCLSIWANPINFTRFIPECLLQPKKTQNPSKIYPKTSNPTDRDTSKKSS